MGKGERSGSESGSSFGDVKRSKTENTPAKKPEQDTESQGQPNRTDLVNDTSLSPKEPNERGYFHFGRFQRLGELNDIEKAVEYLSRVLDLTPDDHPYLPSRISNVGAAYGNRFQRLGQLDDLEKSIAHSSRALALTPDDHPSLPLRLSNLGVYYTDRYRRLGALDDLANAIKHDSRALELTPDGHPDLSSRHANLGVSYRDRYQRLGELDDLANAIKHKDRALELTPDGHPDLSSRHASLGASYTDRYQRLGTLDDLDKAIEHNSRALELTPDGHPDLPVRHLNLAITLFDQYQYTGDFAHSNHALESYRKSSQLSTGAPRLLFDNALRWAKSASIHSSHNCIEAYKTTINLLPKFIWLGASISQQYQDLSTVENLAVNAAFAAICCSEWELALEWLEHARCVVWNRTLMLRSPLDQLQSSHPELATRLRTISIQLHHAGTDLPAPDLLSSGSADPEHVGQRRRHLAKEYDNLIAEARSLQGYEDLLQPMRSNDLVHAARNGPVVVINCHSDRCDALVILPGNGAVEHLPLPNFTAEKARSARIQFHMKGLRERGVKVLGQSENAVHIAVVLSDLWKDVVKPVLDFLGYTDNTSTNDLPHITWCPTGPLSFLPLHAAGDYDHPRSRVFNYAISSYTPTLTALLASTPSVLNRDCRVLAVGQANTPNHSRLPGTVQELAYIEAHAQNTAKFSQIVNDQATTEAVLDAMEHHDWVHLACHAHQNVEDPTRSGFYLHDGTLDLASINRRSFKKKGLAFLSACQTATGDEKLPDEAVHLASGMLMAGYTSVIATMWSVRDADAPLVADRVYAQLMKDGKLGNGEAGRALHHAVAELRDQVGEKAFGRWVPYIHIGS